MSNDAFIMFMERRIIATDLDCSSKSGSAVKEGKCLSLTRDQHERLTKKYSNFHHMSILLFTEHV